jgi:hypothetical protein
MRASATAYASGGSLSLPAAVFVSTAYPCSGAQ